MMCVLDSILNLLITMFNITNILYKTLYMSFDYRKAQDKAEHYCRMFYKSQLLYLHFLIQHKYFLMLLIQHQLNKNVVDDVQI